MSPAYNQIIRDMYFTVSNHYNEELYVVTRLYLLETDPATLDKMEATNSTIIFNMEEVRTTKDPILQRLIQSLDKTEAFMLHLEEYWKTTPDWARGEEL
jgi:hypothetical protein